MTLRRPAAGAAAILLLFLLSVLVGCAAAPASTPGPAGLSDDQAGQPASQPEPGSDGEITADAQTGLRDTALVVFTGRLRLEVTDIGPAVDSATNVVVNLGGYVSGSQEENTSARHAATVTYRIPSARWTEALRGLRGVGERVVAENTEAAEVTAEVVDLDARIANLRAGETALQEIMNRAGSIDEVLKVQRELSSVRGQIEQLTARRDNLQAQAAYGTLAVSFETPVVAVTSAQEGWQLGAELDRAVAQLIRIGQGLTSLVIWLAVVVLPVVVPFSLLAFVGYRLLRRFTPGTPPVPPAA